MAQASALTMALAAPPTPSADVSARGKHADALMTPPSSVSPGLPAALGATRGVQSPPLMSTEESDLGDVEEHPAVADDAEPRAPAGTPLSKGALSGLDATAAITASMLAKHHLPGIMLGNGPKPIRYVMGELTQTVPGFSRIAPAKARRLVVAALESRNGGGPDGSVAFCKTGWGRWDAHIKGSPRDSGIGSLNEGHFSPPRSERSSYAMSHCDSTLSMAGPRMPSGYRDHHSGGSWSASSLREEDEFDMDMDVPENEADKMSLDDACLEEEEDAGDGSDSFDDATDDEDVVPLSASAPWKASLPPPGVPRKNYNAISVAYARRWSSNKSRRPSALSALHSTSLPCGGAARAIRPSARATPEEQAAAAALLSMGSM